MCEKEKMCTCSGRSAGQNAAFAQRKKGSDVNGSLTDRKQVV